MDILATKAPVAAPQGETALPGHPGAPRKPIFSSRALFARPKASTPLHPAYSPATDCQHPVFSG